MCWPDRALGCRTPTKRSASHRAGNGARPRVGGFLALCRHFPHQGRRKRRRLSGPGGGYLSPPRAGSPQEPEASAQNLPTRPAGLGFCAAVAWSSPCLLGAFGETGRPLTSYRQDQPARTASHRTCSRACPRKGIQHRSRDGGSERSFAVAASGDVLTAASKAAGRCS